MPRPARIAKTVPGKSRVKQEQKRERTAASHLKLIRQLPCCACARPPKSDPHHLMRGVERGMGMPAAGRFTIPLCRGHHEEITPHGDPEAVLMERYGIDARALADALWAASGDLPAMERIALRALQDAAMRRTAPSISAGRPKARRDKAAEARP